MICMRRLFETKFRHFLGLAPTAAQPGDRICILFSCSVPVVLRSVVVQETGSKYYKFIGECYVHGLMEAEAKEQQLKHSNSQDKNPRLKTRKRMFELR